MTLFHKQKLICEDLKAHIGHNTVITEYEETEEVTVECEDCCAVLLSFYPYNIDEDYPTSDSMTEMLGAGQIMSKD